MKKQNRRSRRKKRERDARRKGLEGRIEAKKTSRENSKKKMRKQSGSDPVIELEPEEPIENGLQSHEISNNECALCFGLYDDDFSSIGKSQRDWVRCTRMTSKKWMHADCLNQDNNMYECGLCKMLFC